MIEKIDWKNVSFSIVIGILIGIISRYYLIRDVHEIFHALSIISSAILGLVIGLIVETFTALLPCSIAGTKLFFLINNIMAIAITLILLIILYFTGFMKIAKPELYKVLMIAAALIALINFIDYINYRITNRKLKRFQNRIINDPETLK